MNKKIDIKWTEACRLANNAANAAYEQFPNEGEWVIRFKARRAMLRSDIRVDRAASLVGGKARVLADLLADGATTTAALEIVRRNANDDPWERSAIVMDDLQRSWVHHLPQNIRAIPGLCPDRLP